MSNLSLICIVGYAFAAKAILVLTGAEVDLGYWVLSVLGVVPIAIHCAFCDRREGI